MGIPAEQSPDESSLAALQNLTAPPSAFWQSPDTQPARRQPRAATSVAIEFVIFGGIGMSTIGASATVIGMGMIRHLLNDWRTAPAAHGSAAAAE